METNVKKRAGFITFWLWLGIIANIFSVISSVIQYQNLKNLGVYGMELISAGYDISGFSNTMTIYVIIMQAIAVISAILLIAGYRALLKWRKSGFRTIVLTTIFIGLVQMVVMFLIQQQYLTLGLSIYPIVTLVIYYVTMIFSIVLLWGILHIKKNGVSCWSQLE